MRLLSMLYVSLSGKNRKKLINPHVIHLEFICIPFGYWYRSRETLLSTCHQFVVPQYIYLVSAYHKVFTLPSFRHPLAFMSSNFIYLYELLTTFYSCDIKYDCGCRFSGFGNIMSSVTFSTS